MSLEAWFRETRPNFLLLTPFNYSVGLAVAYVEGSFHAGRALLGLVGVILAHLAINVLNEYFDHRSGLDFMTRKTPFSGGSGVLPVGSLRPGHVYIFAMACLLLGGTIGVYLSYTVGWGLLPIVLVAAFTIYFYTPLLSHWYLGELSTGLSYGSLMVVGAYFIMTGRYSLTVLPPSAIPGLLGATLLVINEFPDMEPDRKVGRRNLVMFLGLRRASWLYAMLVASPYLVVLWSISAGSMPLTMLVTFVSLPVGVRSARGAMAHYDDFDALVQTQGDNVLWILSLTLFTSVGLLLPLLV